MNRLLISTCFLSVVAIIAACSSDPSQSENKSTARPALQVEVADQASPDTSTSETTGPVKIAAVLPTSGLDSAAAKAFSQGMQLAVDAQSPRTLELAAQTEPKNETVVIYWNTNDIPTPPLGTEESPVLSIPVWNVDRSVARLGQSVMGFGYSSERSFVQLAKFAGKNLKSYRFAIISSAANPFETHKKEFVEETKSLGNTVVFDEKAESATADFAALVKRATKETCDTIFAALPGDSLVALIKAARAAGYKGTIIVGDSLFASELAALGRDAEGIYILQAWADDPAFEKQFVAKFGGLPDKVTLGAAALGYDLIKCIDAAGPNPDASSIRYSWLSEPCTGLTGKTQFTGERMAIRTKRILTVKDGKFEAVG